MHFHICTRKRGWLWWWVRCIMQPSLAHKMHCFSHSSSLPNLNFTLGLRIPFSMHPLCHFTTIVNFTIISSNNKIRSQPACATCSLVQKRLNCLSINKININKHFFTIYFNRELRRNEKKIVLHSLKKSFGTDVDDDDALFIPTFVRIKQ